MPQSTDEQLPHGLSMRLTEVQFHLAVDRGIFGITLHRENLLTLVMELILTEEVANSLLTASTSPLSAVSCS